MLAAIAIATLMTAFHELDAMCARDNGHMWGVSICGPTVFVEPQTRHFVAKRGGEITEGTMPASIGIANTAVDWQGDRWTMVLLPLPADAYARRVLLAHESFHRIQPKLGLVAKEVPNAHLDAVEGRYLMQLEWRALAAALGGDRKALSDALAFREKRREMFPNAAAEEDALERNEGLAEYTGTAFAEPSLPKRIPHLIEALQKAEKTPTFSRSFAYATGPAWGALREMGYGEAKFGAAELLTAERARDAKRQATLRDLRARFIDGRVLTLPLHKMQFEMDPNKAQPFEPYGTVYPALTLRDDWGEIVVKSGGALISADWLRLTVPRDPAQNYTLTLNEGWKIEGDTVIKR
jgi:hypothetical protein